MFIMLVLLTFVAGILLDHYLTRAKILVVDQPAPAPRLPATVVGGFSLPPNLRYHVGHTWAASESPGLVRIGADDLAVKVAGALTSVDLPERGRWVRQGQRIAALHRDGREIDLVSPIEGTVVGINEMLLRDPNLARKDPYGDGWLVAVNAPDASTNFRNLLSGNIARRWMEESAAMLRMLSPGAVAAAAQDGGIALDDVVGHLTEAQFRDLAASLFLN